MIKKTLILTVLCAVAVALVSLPAKPASADIIVICPVGTTNASYCEPRKVCNVQSLGGMRLKKAKQTLKAHDCQVGKVKRKSKKLGKGKHWVVVRQSLPSGLYRAGQKVNLTVKGRR